MPIGRRPNDGAATQSTMPLLNADALIPATLVLALLIDFWIGDPAAVYRVIPHPVAMIGGLIGRLEARWNAQTARPDVLKALGALTLAISVGLPTGLAVAASWGLRQWEFGWLGEALVASIFLAQRSLVQHVSQVAHAFDGGGLSAAREAVAHIVGRDPSELDETGVSRAAIESCAENFSDGVAAPVFWFAVLGLPGIVAYKAINTADSMIGHKSDRYFAFGWSAARLDDVVNWPAARLAGLLIGIGALFTPDARWWPSVRTMARDAKLHRSPNAGWPEGAVAGALGIALAGPRVYPTHTVEDPFLNKGAGDPARSDIRRSVDLIWRAWLLILIAAGAWLAYAVFYAGAPAS